MKRPLILILLAATVGSTDPLVAQPPHGRTTTPAEKGKRLRVVITTDFPPIGVVKEGNVPNEQKSDPDDMQSMVRFLLYANEFDIEALMASSGTFANKANKQNILDVIDRYESVYENLKKHDPLYPAPDRLRSITFQGRSGTWGRKGTENIGAGKDCEASDALIAVVDKPDPRPVYVCVWGDCSVVAQAVWKVQDTRGKAKLEAFLSKLRIHQIATQDGTIGWLRDAFPQLFILHSQQTYQDMFGGRDPASDLAWVNENIRKNHGPLCEIYPHEGIGCTGVCEGDSPSFLWLVSANRGLNDPDDPTQESWGGQFKKDGATNHYIDGPGRASISKWRRDFQREFSERADWCVSQSSQSTAVCLATQAKPRMVVLTDVCTWETDDSESLVRLLVHADMLEIEGLVFTTGWNIGTTRDDFLDLIHVAVDAYEKDCPNLRKRSGQNGHARDESRQNIGYWPSPQYLRKRTMFGSKKRGAKHVGEGNDSPGSQLIIDLADEEDERPVWIAIWGGGNTLAQAIWRVQQDRSEAALKAFLQKLRVYAITDQDRDPKAPLRDSSHQWMRKEFGKDLLFIWDECAWKYQNGTGRQNWTAYETHVQNHGHLGRVYPKYKYGVEGDTPTFLHLMPVGLNDPNVPTHGGWGGYFAWGAGADHETPCFTNYQNPEQGVCRKLEDHFYPAAFNNFAARMDWAKDGTGNRNPIVVIDGNKSLEILTKAPQQGTTVTLDALGSFDPDGNGLNFNFWVLSAAGTYDKAIEIANSGTGKATIKVPADSAGKTFHVICEATDDGMPKLSGYRRIIFKPTI